MEIREKSDEQAPQPRRHISNREYYEELVKIGLIEFKPFSWEELLVKRTIDIIGGLFGTLLFIAVALVLIPPYLFAEEKDKGPMLYKQKRYGYHGKIFYIWKFRTMIMDAENYLATHPDIEKKYHENGNKLINDPRVTKIGSFIRNKSIDELPQFFNVLKGDMSLVGPRPILLFERKEYDKSFPYLEMCRPGITGYWTTHGRSKVLFPERASLELKYLSLHSFMFDFLTIIMTVVQTFHGSDAY